MNTGIYRYKNLVNGMSYIGQSIDIHDRAKQHRYRYNIEGDSGYNTVFHAAIREYGIDAFKVEVLELCDADTQDDKERYYIDLYNSLYPNGYNIYYGHYHYHEEKDPLDFVCPVCGGAKSEKAYFCRRCSDECKRSKTLPDKDITIEFIDHVIRNGIEKSARSVGYKNGATLRKRLRKIGIPTKISGLISYYEQVTGVIHPNNPYVSEKEKKPKITISVVQRDIDGDMIEVFQSMNDAFRKTGVHSGHISECLSGKRERAGGYYWTAI